ncbi:hypothetical protein EC2016001_0737 [Escherichia coli 201600.1]|nr:hypothetical protein EC2016001_0737 [Escherichia coli 201600.1]
MLIDLKAVTRRFVHYNSWCHFLSSVNIINMFNKLLGFLCFSRSDEIHAKT